MNKRHARILFLAMLLGIAGLAFTVGQYLSYAEAAGAKKSADGQVITQVQEQVVLKDLLARPDPEGTPTEILVGVYVIDIGDIDDVSQTFEVNFATRLQWKDSRLATGKKGVVKKYDIDDVWNPHVLLLNRRGMELLYPDVVLVDDIGNVVYMQRFYGDMGFRLHLKHFPLDEHALPITIVSGRYTPQRSNS